MAPRRPKVPKLEPLAAPQNAEERKERQRLHVKRAYYKKLNEMQNQRDRVHQLEKEYARLVAQKKERASARIITVEVKRMSLESASPNDPDMDDQNVDGDILVDQLFDSNVGELEPVGVVPTNIILSKQDQYTEISELKEKLHAENMALRAMIAEHERFAQQLTTWMRSDSMAVDDNATTCHHDQLATPLTLNFCQAIARAAHEDMRQFRQSRGFVSSGLSVFGWRDRRLPEGDRARFSLTKLFKGRTAHELSLRGWSALSSAKSVESMYSASSNARISTLQDVDDNNTVLLRVMTSPDGKLLAKTLFLVTQFVIPNGFIVCLKSIDPNLLVPSQLPVGVTEKWVEHSSWVAFESTGDDGEDCEVEFSGEVQLNPLVPQEVWLLEILFYILRFEGKLTGPVFSLC